LIPKIVPEKIDIGIIIIKSHGKIRINKFKNLVISTPFSVIYPTKLLALLNHIKKIKIAQIEKL
jgi:hypothetical protein